MLRNQTEVQEHGDGNKVMVSTYSNRKIIGSDYHRMT